MAKKPTKETGTLTIWEALDAWSKELSPWQQYIVGTAANQGKVKKVEIDQAYKLFQIDKKLTEVEEGEKVPEIPPALGRPTGALTEKLTLNKIDHMIGINALPDNAGLSFSDGLTIIYGENGAGKTGFSRLMSNAGFSRHKPEMLGDINNDDEVDQTAQFHISVGDKAQDPIKFPIEEDISPLKRITCFDAMVARHHLTQAAAFEFKPAGFDVFPEIGRVYGILEGMLQEDIDSKTEPNEFPSLFAGPRGLVYEAMLSLSADTDIEAIRKLAVYGKVESDRIDSIGKEITALASKASKESVDSMKEAKGDVETLAKEIVHLEELFNEEALAARNKLITEGRDTAAAAALLGADQFKRSFFNAVGSSEWQTFAKSAHSLAKKEGLTYPTEGSRCLLCEQELDSVASAHVTALLAYVEGDARKTAEAAATAINTEIQRLRSLNLNIFLDSSRVRAHVRRLEAKLEGIADAALATIVAARDSAIESLEKLQIASTPIVPSGADIPFTQFSKSLAEQIAALAKNDVEAATKKLEEEKHTLRHRQVLSQNLTRVEAFINNKKWIRTATAAKASLNTLQVTNKEKALSEQIIGDSYRTKFAEECLSFNCIVPVEFKTAGRNGQTLHSLTMKGGHRVDSILSEGEQKAVAIADFLTEVALNPAAAGIVLDDPVSTLDDLRKEKIAERLVKEAATRQVIIFTHDFVFLNQLYSFVEAYGTPMIGHWVERDADGRPGQVSAGDLPVTSKIYQTTARAEEALARATSAKGSAREKELQHGMGCLRTTLEETVVRKLFKDIVPKWSDRVIVTALKKVNWDNVQVDRIVVLYEELSGLMVGHTDTDQTRGTKSLQPKDLEDKIAEVKAMITWAKLERQ